MAIIESTIAPSSAAYKANREGMLALIARMRALEERARASANPESRATISGFPDAQLRI